MDRVQAMTVFVAVAEAGGFAPVARKLKLSPSAVTRAVAELEERLGLQLLTRTTRSVRLTEAGACFARDCRHIIAEIEEAEAAAMGAHGSVRGTLALTAPVLFGQLHVTPILVTYLRRFPDVDAQCYFLDRVVNLVDEGLDVAIRIGELPDSSLQAIQVGRVRRVVVASPDYLKANGIPITPDDLASHVIVSAAGITPAADWRFVHKGQMITVAVNPRMQTTTNDSAIATAVQGFGVARLFNYQVATQLESGQLKIVLEDHEEAPLPVHVVHHQGRRSTRKVRAFIDLAVDALRASSALNWSSVSP
jgi:DNA-binding transcriptional LysR family regulator